ncbi:arylesterase [Caulobacter sp. SLTY]|nr:arylesterase [Caulobacter sp. SLTY]NBB14115.1 arylesterase [Caulobacter sp. SLTY]
MAMTPERFLSRRAVLAGAVLAAPGVALAQPKPRIVTLLGDSITAGLGLPSRSALPFVLETELNRLGGRARVRGAGVSGDTSAAGLARVDFSVQADTTVCVVALGGNDLLQGLDPRRTSQNLDRIVARLKARRIKVVLAGMRPPPALGRSYARDFAAIFPTLARKHGAVLYPDLLAGVAGVPRLNQRDGIHPNTEGVKIIARGLAPTVVRALG